MAALAVATLAVGGSGAFGAPGSYDRTFGGTGVVVGAPVAPGSGQRLAVQPDGKILVASSDGTDGRLLRWTADGRPDPSFAPSPLTGVAVGGMAVASDGRIVVVGSRRAGPEEPSRPVVVALRPNGARDAIFGQIGVVELTSIGSARAVAIAGDQKVVVGGQTEPGGGFVARFSTAGVLDTTFGGTGIVRPTVTDSTVEWVTSLVVDQNGVTLAGNVPVPVSLPSPRFVPAVGLVRLTASGALDTAFGNNGLAPYLRTGYVNDLVRRPDGTYLVGATDFTGALVLHFDANGDWDSSFGGTGEAHAPVAGDVAGWMGLAADQGIIVARGASLVRFNPNGSRDITFGCTGAVTLRAAPQIAAMIVAGVRAIVAVSGPIASDAEVAATSLHALSVGPLEAAGFWAIGADGRVEEFARARHCGGLARPDPPIVAASGLKSGTGYWMTAADGGVFAFGRIGFYGSLFGVALNRPIVTMATTPSERGYWIAASDGGVFAFGDAQFHGSTGGLALVAPIVTMAVSGKGYWLAASDGGVFAFGDAQFHGSTGGLALNRPIVAMAPTPTGRGYWLVASDGGVFAFGDAQFHGSTGGLALNRPIVGMAPTAIGRGYWLVASDGGVFAFGDAPFIGSGVGVFSAPVVAVAPTMAPTVAPTS